MKRLLVPLAAALIGLGLLIALFPRIHPAANWGFVFDRRDAIDRARAFASSQGLNTAAWNVYVTGEYRARLELYHALYSSDEVARRIGHIFTRVTLVNADKSRVFACDLYPDGRIAGWERKQPRADPLAPYAPMEDAGAAAEKAFRLLAGPDASGYQKTTSGAGTKTGSRFTWERIQPSPVLQPTIDVIVHRAQTVHAETHLQFSKDFELKFSADRLGPEWLRIAYYILYFVMLIAASVFYTLGAIQKKVAHRFAVTFSFVNVFFIALASYYGPSPDSLRSTAALESGTAAAEFTGLVIGLISAAGLAWVVSGAGLFVAGALRDKWWSLRLLLSRRLASRPVGMSIAAGVLWAPLLTAVPFVAAAFFPHLGWNVRDAGELFSKSLLLQATNYPLHPTVVGLFGILLAFAVRRIRVKPLRLLAVAVLGTLFVLGFENQFESSAGANLISAALLFGAMYELFRRFDLLAAIVAQSVRVAVYLTAELLAQPSPALHAAAWPLVAFTLLLFATGLFLMSRTADVRSGEEAKDEGLAGGIHSAREELKSQFSVAQRAQREMLPLRPPVLAGFSLAAHCTPAKDVGGDLYDFLPLTGDRMAIAVADVSGKGVPAALYMTLTKGLLVATTEDNLPLPRMLEQINTHLYAVGRRKTFVTMAIGILDVKARTLDYARAGHNPVVWRSPSAGSTRLLESPGLGLGITGGPVFARKLEVERLSLSSGDTLVFYSDGLTEAMNQELEEFGEERLMRAVEGVDALHAAAARDRILATVTTFLNGNHPQDDLTLVVLRVE